MAQHSCVYWAALLEYAVGPELQYPSRSQVISLPHCKVVIVAVNSVSHVLVGPGVG